MTFSVRFTFKLTITIGVPALKAQRVVGQSKVISSLAQHKLLLTFTIRTLKSLLIKVHFLHMIIVRVERGEAVVRVATQAQG